MLLLTITKTEQAGPLTALLVGVMALILYLAYKKQWLTLNGCIAAFILGSSIVLFASPMYLFPIGIFFITGSLTSKLLPASKDATGRNAVQVFSNGVVGVVALILAGIFDNQILMCGYFISICISFSDTISSDIGIYFRHKTYDITTFKPIKPGLSGGISAIGTISGIVAALMFSAGMFLLFSFPFFQFIIVACAGITGMLTDSLLGSVLQVKYRDHGYVTEEKTETAKPIKGYIWIDNNMVNLISNLIVTTGFVATMFYYHF